jgi:hypothetical protein
MDIKFTIVLTSSRPQSGVSVNYVHCLHTNILVRPVGPVPGANLLNSFVYMFGCMNNVRNVSYEVSCFVCNNAFRNL